MVAYFWCGNSLTALALPWVQARFEPRKIKEIQVLLEPFRRLQSRMKALTLKAVDAIYASDERKSFVTWAQSARGIDTTLCGVDGLQLQFCLHIAKQNVHDRV